MPVRKIPFRQKSEYRNSKLETISNIKFFNVQNKSLDTRLFRAFEHSNLEFVSDFVIRISNFKIQKLRVFVQALFMAVKSSVDHL